MIGLALSMGASSLLLPRQDDSAAAAEPITAETPVAVVPLAFHVAALPSDVATESPVQPTTETTSLVSHVVREGQTLWQLSRRYGVPVRAIAEANGITADTILRVGQVVKVPVTARAAASDAVATERPVLEPASAGDTPSPHVSEITSPSPLMADALVADRDDSLNRLRQQRDKLRESLAELGAEDLGVTEPSKAQVDVPSLVDEGELVAKPEELDSPGITFSDVPQDEANLDVYQVKPGDTLGDIALQHEISQQELAMANQLDNPNLLRVDQDLVIPSASALLPSPVVTEEDLVATSDTVASHRVNPGETIDEIADLHGISEETLIAANQIPDPNFILVGQVLTIPGSGMGESANVPSAPDLLASVPGTVPSLATQAESLTTVPPITQVPTVVAVPTSPLAARMPSPDSTVVAAPEAAGAGVLFSTEFVTESGEGFLTNTPSQDVAVAPTPLATPGTSIEVLRDEVTVPERDPFLDNLVSEIMTLRDRYRAEAEALEAPEIPEVVAVAPIDTSEALVEFADPGRMNPQFSPTSAESLEAADLETTDLSVDASSEVITESTASTGGASNVDESQLVAVAPLGSENYAPLLESLTGQIVSPDLPPLPTAEAYLPDGSLNFDGYIWPARGVLTSGYGWRWGRMHRGIDIGAPTGTPVYAAAAGVVEFSGWNSGGYGNMVEIRHPDGSMTRYAHHSRNLVRVGQRVNQGDQIAEVGSTGYSTGPHLHFEVHLPSQGTVNPIAYLPGR